MSLRMTRPSCLTLGLILMLSTSLAAAAPAPTKGTLAARPVDYQVLDFMADWQGDDGQWADPMTFARIDPAKVKAEATKRHSKSMAAPGASGTGAPVAGTGLSHDAR